MYYKITFTDDFWLIYKNHDKGSIIIMAFGRGDLSLAYPTISREPTSTPWGASDTKDITPLSKTDQIKLTISTGIIL